MGRFPATTPAMMRAAIYCGPRSVAEMVDRHGDTWVDGVITAMRQTFADPEDSGEPS